jgi:vacuolar-type H+-ATPase subunit F/Vma7
MADKNENQNDHAGRRNGKPRGRPAGVSAFHDLVAETIEKAEKRAAEKRAAQAPTQSAKKPQKRKPLKKPAQKKVPKENIKIEAPSGIPEDFKIPVSFFEHMGDPRFRAQAEEYGEQLLRTNQDFLPTANDISLSGPNEYQSALANWHSGAARYLPVRISWLSAIAQLVVEQSIKPKIECTYDANGRLKTKKITSGKGDSGAIAVAQSLLEMEMKWAEKMKPAQNSRVILEVPAGGDVRKHKILDLIRKKIGLKKMQAQESEQNAP